MDQKILLSLDSLQVGGLLSSFEQMQTRQVERIVTGLAGLVNQIRDAEEGKDGSPEQKLAGKLQMAEDELADATEKLAAKQAKADAENIAQKALGAKDGKPDRYIAEAVEEAQLEVSKLTRKVAGIKKHGANYSRY